MNRLGRIGTDKITGFSGVIVGEVKYLTGCTQLLIQPRLGKDNEFPESKWIDEDRVTVSGDPIVLEVKSAGFDREAPRR